MSSLTGYPGNTGATSGSYSKPPKFADKLPEGYKGRAIQQFTPEMMDLFQTLFGHVMPGSYLSRLAGGDQALFKEIEAPAHTQFASELGNIASRFSGMGLGGRRSSGFQHASTQAASDFAQQLQSQRQGLQRQAIGDLMGMSQSLLNQRPYERFLEKEQQKQGWGGAIGAGLGGLGGFFAGGPMGAMTGAQLGYGIGSQF